MRVQHKQWRLMLGTRSQVCVQEVNGTRTHMEGNLRIPLRHCWHTATGEQMQQSGYMRRIDRAVDSLHIPPYSFAYTCSE